VVSVSGVSSEALYQELVHLRKGLGVQSARSASDIGLELQTLCGISSLDTAAVVRRKLQAGLNALLSDLSEEERIVARVTLGLHPESTGRLERRIEWLAQGSSCSLRTARRRIDEAFRLLADASNTVQTGRSPHGVGTDWMVDELRTLVRLDRPGAVLIQERKIIAVRDDVEHVSSTIGLPGRAEEFHVEVLFGGTLKIVERRSTVIRYAIELPSTLRQGEFHTYAVQLRFPDDQPLAPHYVLQPAVQLRRFALRVRFDSSHMPTQVWRVDTALHREIDDPDAGDAMLPDRAGEVIATFNDFRPGHAYGVAWSWSDGENVGVGLESH
jgi:hypothetical protein